MGTFGQSKKTANKERIKAIKKANSAQANLDKTRLANSKEEEISMKIAELKSRIKNVKADLDKFPGNNNIKLKYKDLGLQLLEREEELKELNFLQVTQSTQ